jgi:hypothetical protein
MTIMLNEQNKFVTLQMAAEAFLTNSEGESISGRIASCALQ